MTAQCRKKIRFALIGASSMAPYHLYCLRNNPDAEVVSIFSRKIERAQDFALHFNITAAGSYEEILQDASIDALDIVTEPSRHAELALAAIKNGKHVLVEKPLASDLASACKVVDEAGKCSTVVSVISKMRFIPSLFDMKEQIENHVIGRPIFSEVKIIWPRTDAYYNYGNGWRSKDGNILLNQSVHWLDYIIWLFGMPTNIAAITESINKNLDCYDTALCRFMFSNGMLLNLFCSTAIQKFEREEFTIYGTDGVLNYNPEDRRKKGLIKRIGNRLMGAFVDPRKIKILGSPLQAQIDDFIGAIINKRPPRVSIVEAYNTLKVIDEIQRSHV